MISPSSVFCKQQVVCFFFYSITIMVHAIISVMCHAIRRNQNTGQSHSYLVEKILTLIFFERPLFDGQKMYAI